MGRAAYQHVDNLRIGHSPCGRIGRIEASLKALMAHGAWVQAYAKAIAVAYPDCQKVTELLPIEGRKCFRYRDGQGNLKAGELR